jgi:hypothetical protein
VRTKPARMLRALAIVAIALSGTGAHAAAQLIVPSDAAAAHVSSAWSTGLGNWNPRQAQLFGFRRQGLPNVQTLPVTILGQRLVLSHFTVTRRRVSIALSTGF